jgi:polysaccharide biosynthesis protein PslA
MTASTAFGLFCVEKGMEMTISTADGAPLSAVPGIQPAGLSTANLKKRWSRKVACDVAAFLDGVAVFAGAAVPAAIYGSVGDVVTNWTLLAQTSAAAALITHLYLRYWNQYDKSKINDLPVHPGCMMAALLIGILAMSGLGLPHAIQDGHIWIWFLTWYSASFTFLVMTRGLSRIALAKLTATGRFDQRVAVFGAGAIARRVHDYLVTPGLGIRFAGLYDDRAGQERMNAEGLDVAGRIDELIASARNDEIDQIIIALPQAAGDRIALIARKLEQLPVSVHIVTHIASDLMDARPQHLVSSLGPVGLLDVKPKPLTGWAPLVKRLEDKFLGTLLLLAASPLFPLIAIVIKAEDRGKVFYKQKRRGLNQRVFEVIKFRTMNVLEQGADVQQAKPGDARITFVGSFLRRMSLDELPQLINVLKGDMSLVGPRPHALVHDDKFSEELETYANRQQVKPGMTGLAQVRGFRGETLDQASLKARVDADIEYIRTWSLGLDLWILMKTISAVLTGKNAH